MTDLWVEASRDLDAEHLAVRMAQAKVTAAAVWPFLASAKTPNEFEHRLALSYRQLAHSVEPELLDSLVASLRDDYSIMAPVQREAIRTTANHQVAAATVPVQFFDRQRGRWVTAAAQETPGNPGAGDPTPEHGPLTGETGTYPIEVDGPDPWNPMNGRLPLPPGTAVPPANRFPAEPQPWTSTPESAWREDPMQFTPPRQGSRQPRNVVAFGNPYDPDAQPVAWVHWERMAAASGDSLSYTDEGTETGPGPNPNYFGEGAEGLQSTDGGFPEDVALPEPDERVDMYRNMTTPTAQAPMAGMPPATADYKYVKPNPDGDGWVITQKGTGKILSHHDSQDEAEASFRAMMQSKHGARQSPFFDPRLIRTADTTNFVDDNPYQDTQDMTEMPVMPPDPPQSMTPGGAGAEAMTGGGGASTIPTSSAPSSTSPDPGGADAAGKTGMRRHAEDDYRGRPNPSDPTGVGDDYTANTWENAIKQSPRQSVEDRGANTPQRSAPQIPQNSSSNMGGGEEEDEDDEDRREAALRHYVQTVALRAAQAAVRAA